MTRKSLQKGLIFLAIREEESNATLRLSLTPFRMNIIKTEMRTNTGIIWGNGSPYILLVGAQLRIVTSEVSLEVQKNNKQNSRSTYYPAPQFRRTNCKESIPYYRDSRTTMFTAALFTVVRR